MTEHHSLTAISIVGLLMGFSSATWADDDADNRIEKRIESHMARDRHLKNIDVDVDAGVTTLKGRVANDAERVRAEKVARSSGARHVENQIEVDVGTAKDRIEENADRAKEAIDDRAERAKRRVDDRAKAAKERLEEGRDSSGKKSAASERVETRRDVERAPARQHTGKSEPGAELSDAWITTKVKSGFVGEDLLKGSDISVDTNQDGVVTLTGTVPTEAARARAVAIAKAIKGVRRVHDALRIAVDTK